MKKIAQITITILGTFIGLWAGLFCAVFILGLLCGLEGIGQGIICHDTPWFYTIFLTLIVVFIILGGILGYKGGIRVGKWITRSPAQGSGAAYEYPSPLTPPQPNHPGLKRYCSNCGTGLDPNGLFCPECGSPSGMPPPLTQQDAPSSPATVMVPHNPPHPISNTPRKPGFIWMYIIVVGVVLLFFLFIGVISDEKNDLAIEMPIEIAAPLPLIATPLPASIPKEINHFEQGEQYLWRDENYVKAIDSFTKYINLNPNDAMGYEKRGNSYQELKRYQEALQDYNKAIELNPDNSPDIYAKRGGIFGDLSQYQEAIKDYNKWLKLDPETLWPYHYKGMAYRQLEQYDLAIQSWERYVELRLIESASWRESEQAAGAYTNIGLAYIELGRNQKAIDYFDQVLTINQFYSDAITGKEKALQRLITDAEAQILSLDATYIHDTAGFSIDYPSEWIVTEGKDLQAPDWILPDIDFKTLNGASLKIEIGFNPGVHLEDFTHARILGDNTFKETSRITIETIPAYLSNGAHIPGDNPADILIVVNDPYEISVVFSPGKGSEESDKSTFAAMIKSFKIFELSR